MTVVFGIPSLKNFFGSTGVPRKLPASVGFTVFFCFLVCFFVFSKKKQKTWFRYHITRTFVFLLGLTSRDQFRDRFFSISNRLEGSICSVISFSGALLCDGLNCLWNLMFASVFCLSYGMFRKAEAPFAACLQSHAELPVYRNDFHNNFVFFLVARAVVVFFDYLAVVWWHCHVSCYGFLAPYVLSFHSSDSFRWYWDDRWLERCCECLAVICFCVSYVSRWKALS